MPTLRHAPFASTARATPPVDRPRGVRPAMRPGTTDKASAVAHYQAMAEQVALDRWVVSAALEDERSDTGGGRPDG